MRIKAPRILLLHILLLFFSGFLIEKRRFLYSQFLACRLLRPESDCAASLATYLKLIRLLKSWSCSIWIWDSSRVSLSSLKHPHEIPTTFLRLAKILRLSSIQDVLRSGHISSSNNFYLHKHNLSFYCPTIFCARTNVCVSSIDPWTFFAFFPPKRLHVHIHRTNTEHFMLIQRLSTPSLSTIFNFCTVKTRYFVYFMAIISLLDIISRDYTSLNEQLNATNCLRYCHSVLACRRNGCSIVIVSLDCWTLPESVVVGYAAAVKCKRRWDDDGT